MNNKVLELEDKIRYYAQKYYEGNPEISDQIFDELVDELRKLYPESEVLNKTGWGYEPTIGEKVSHKYQKMGSLGKAKTWDAIPDVFKNNGPVCVSQKLDGLSAVVYYKNGNLVQGITRGNGEIGIDITDKMRILAPNYIKEFTGAVRGELIIPNKNWKLMKELNPDLISARNTAAGIINRNEITDDLSYVVFCVYKVVGCEGNVPFSNTLEMRKFLMDNFSNTVTTLYPVLYDERFWNTHSEYTFEEMKEKGYSIDGLVLTMNEFNIKENGAIEYEEIAYKFKSETAETKVTGIEWNLSRNQRLVPVVEIEPVELSGAIIKRATGFNAKYILDNKIDIDAIIEIERSGEVIPYINKVIEKPSVFKLPEVCPVCREKLEWNGVDLVCNNIDCSNRSYSNLMVWSDIIGKVDGLGRNIKANFFKENEVNTLEDLYNKPLGYNIETATGKKLDKFVNKILFDQVDIIDALCALNIPRLGRTTATKLAENVELCKKFVNYALTRNIDQNTIEEITKIIGQATAKQILVAERLNSLKYISDRLSYPMKKEHIESVGKIAVTGSLEGMTRKQFEELVSKYGYSLTSNMKDAEYLVTNNPDPTSSKGKKAKELGIGIITQKEFIKMLDSK